MKKLILGAVLATVFAGSSIAQQAATPTKEVKKTVTTKAEQAKPAKPNAVADQTVIKKKEARTLVISKPAVTPAVAAAPAPAVVLKKDGTPDKRFKNAAATEKGPLKKDGTADMRYKKNKKG